MSECKHQVKKTVRSSSYDRAKGLRRREYECVLCGKALDTTYEGTQEDLEAWLQHKIRTKALKEAFEAISALYRV